MKSNQRLIICKTIFMGILYLIYLYLVCRHMANFGFVSLDKVDGSNIYQRIYQDLLVGLPFPTMILIRYRKNYKTLGFSVKNKKLIIALCMAYLMFFFLHSDYSIGGIYRAIFFLIMVGLHEEIVMRGYLYLSIKSINRMLAIIMSGVIFGIGHAITLGTVANKSALYIGVDMLNYVGDGIVTGAVFIACIDLSGTIWVPILIHSLLDYSYGYMGVVILILTLGYLLKQRKVIKKKLGGQIANEDFK